jgi:hypothetical protein
MNQRITQNTVRVVLPTVALINTIFSIVLSFRLPVTDINMILSMLVVTFLSSMIGFLLGMQALWKRDRRLIPDAYLSGFLTAVSMLVTEQQRDELFSSNGPMTVMSLLCIWFGTIRILKIGWRY